MLTLYQKNLLTVVDITEYTVYVEDESEESDPMPLDDAPDGMEIGDDVYAFVYPDSSGDVVATMAEAYAQVGECAYLEVVYNGDRGTFLDWGLPKDLLLPFSKQLGRVREGDFCFVYVYMDENDRPISSMKIYHHLDEDSGDLEVNQAVDLIIAAESEMGFTAVINYEQLGLIYHHELSHPLGIGEKMKGWDKKIRDDGKIDLNINKLDDETRDELEDEILKRLQQNEGRLNLSDKSTPEKIHENFGISKGNFKRAISSLYKKHLISISPDFIELPSDNQNDL
jgi:predicted RNA-binding protein (virulence factor B family)